MMWTRLLMSLALVIGGRTLSIPDEFANISSVMFEKSETFVSSTYTLVYHMELDLYKDDGSILFADGAAGLKTTNGKSTSVVASGFSLLTGFKQINSTHVAAVDRSNHCVKMVNREDRSVRVLAGTCGTRGYGSSDGKYGYGKFHTPWAIELDNKDPERLLVVEFGNRRLRSVEIGTGFTTTIITSGFSNPRALAWKGGNLLVVNNVYISEVEWIGNTTVKNTKIAGTTSAGLTDGDFSISRFYNPHDIHKVQDNLYMVADYNNRRLRLLDFFRRRVVPVCVGKGTSCTSSSVIGNNPTSLLKVGNDIYVGQSGSILKLSGYQCYAPNMTVYVTPYTERANVDLNSDDIGVFPPGEYQFKRMYWKENCMFYVNVHDSPIVRTATFRSEYDATCATLENHISKAFLQSVLAHRNTEFQKLCGKDCAMSSRLQPWFTCEKDLLTVNWPTDTVYSVDVKKTPETFSSPLKEKLKSSPLRNAEMVILSHLPPLVVPKRNSDGETVQMVLTSKCADKAKTYKQGSDNCV